MNPTSKKFIALFLIFSLMMLPTSLYAKKRGAKLIVTKKDGQQIKGELITVKPNSLLLLDTEGKDVSVDIEEIKVIRVVKKLGVLKGALAGWLIGGGVGVLLGFMFPYNEGEINLRPIWYAFLGGGSGILLGGIVGAFAGADKTIQIEGMTDSEIQEALDKLRKKARIRDYK
jgi:small nuclear ribonucleoprotein (snRNP)-like protein